MRWKKGRRSSNIDDRRGMAKQGFKLGGIATVVVVVVSLLMGQNPLTMLDMVDNTFSTTPQQSNVDTGYSEEKDFISVVLADTEDVWNTLLPQHGLRYEEPTLVLFERLVESACGRASAATGPFYCPADKQVYLDLSFFNELKKLGAPGDFAQAYVLGHEVGHHLQNLIGISDQVSRLQQRSSQQKANALSVLLELQADCYAGVWAHHAQKQRNILESGDVEEGLQAAASIGDDRLQQSAGQAVNPDAFTHGSSKQRVQWFTTGLQSGAMDACNTFN